MAHFNFSIIFVTVNRFKNKPNMTFDDAELEPDQTFELCKDDYGVHEYPIRYFALFSIN